MPVLTRVIVAGAMLGFGLWLAQSVRGLVAFARGDAARLGFEMMGIEVGLATIAISIAWALPGRASDRLGLSPSRLPTGAVIALAIGTLGISQAVDGLLKLTRSLEGSVIVGISRGLEGVAGWSFLIAFLGTALAPAIGEELLCRGLLQRSLVRRAGPMVGIVTASLFFGWLHMELVHGAVAASIGLYLGLAAYWADSTRPAIAGHALNNVAALLGSAGLLRVQAPLVPAIAVGLALALGALLWARAAHARAPAPVPPGHRGVPSAGDAAPAGKLQTGTRSADS